MALADRTTIAQGVRAYFIGKLRELDPHSPTDTFPILARLSELQGLGTFPAIRLGDSYSEYPCVHEGKDQVARSNLAH